MHSQFYSRSNPQMALLICLAFLSISCDLFNQDKEGKSKSFVANFTNDWLAENAEGFIIISDLEGYVLNAATWSGNSQIDFGPISESRIIVTTGTRYSTYGPVYMTSNCYVKPGEWTWKVKRQFGYEGSAMLQFTDEPQGDGWYLISGHQYYNIGDLPVQNQDFPLSVIEDDLYLFLSTDEGQQYRWIEDINPGETRNVSLSGLQEPQVADVSMPLSSHFFISFLGYQTAGQYYDRSFYIDSHEMFGEEAVTSFGVNFPVETTDIRTQIVIFDSPEHWDGDYWSFYQYGDVPSSYKKINADFSIVNAQPDSFQIDINGTVDNVVSNWVYNEWYLVKWRVFTNPDFTTFALPKIPPKIAASFNLPSRNEFHLEDVEIMDYPDLDNHDEVIETLFQSDDYFFNIASQGVLIYTKQNNGNGSHRGKNRAADPPEITEQKDPMIPIPYYQ